jgi:hypothetical protein
MVYDCPGAQLAAKYGTSRYSSRCYLNLRSHPSGQKRPFQIATRTDFEPKVPYILSWPEAVLLVPRYSILAFIVSLNTFNFNCFVMPLGNFASLLNCSIMKHFFLSLKNDRCLEKKCYYGNILICQGWNSWSVRDVTKPERKCLSPDGRISTETRTTEVAS